MKRLPSHIKGTALQDGPLISKAANLMAFADRKENGFLLFKLNKRLKIFRGEDGWFAKGRQGQLWEWGKRKLGVTVTTANMITIARAAGFKTTQCGQDEANFSCDWTDANLEKLASMLRLRIRRDAPPHAFERLAST
jgi:hypothetical protein